MDNVLLKWKWKTRQMDCIVIIEDNINRTIIVKQLLHVKDAVLIIQNIL